MHNGIIICALKRIKAVYCMNKLKFCKVIYVIIDYKQNLFFIWKERLLQVRHSAQTSDNAYCILVHSAVNFLILVSTRFIRFFIFCL